MPNEYADRDETLRDMLPNVVISEDPDEPNADQLTVGRYIEAASRLVDTYTNRPDGYFAALAEDSEPTLRRYRGRGHNFLQIGQHVFGSIASVVIGTATLAESAYYEHETNGWLYAADPTAGFTVSPEFYDYRDGGYSFPSGRLYTISARWGFAATPADIVAATKLIVQQIWDRGHGVIGEVTPSGFVIERDMPLTAKTMLTGRIRREFEVN